MPRKPKLTPEQWNDVAEFYKSGHTLEECGRVWGMSGGYIGAKLKKMGIKMRGVFEPSRPEKYERAPAYTQKKFSPPTDSSDTQHSVTDVQQSTRVGTLNAVRLNDTPPVSGRKIISVDGNRNELRYEKEV